jgi:hypothetical protein
MTQYTTTPNMNLLDPTPGVCDGIATAPVGYDYSTLMSDNINIIDAHNHISTGVPIVTAAININGDLVFNNYNATGLRSTRLVSQPSTLSGVGDANCFSSVNGNAYFNNGSGTPVQITSGTSVLVAAANATSLQSNPISSTPATAGQFLLENASVTGNGWFSISGDIVASTSTVGQLTVSSISGSAGTATVLCSNFLFGSAITTPTISQTTVASGTGQAFTVQAQNTSSGTGGELALTSGTGTTAGNVLVQTGGTTAATFSPSALTLAPTSATGQVKFGNDAGSIILQTVGANGLGLTPSPSSINVSGSPTLTAAQYQYSSLLFGGSLFGNTSVTFPTLSTSTGCWFVSFRNLTFNSNTLSIKCGVNTSSVTFTTGATACLVFIDSAGYPNVVNLS